MDPKKNDNETFINGLGWVVMILALSFLNSKVSNAAVINDPTYPAPLRQALSVASEKILTNHPHQALAVLRPLFKSYADYTVVFTMAGMAYGKSGQNEKAVEMEKRALVLDPKNISARISLGIAFGNTGHFRKEIREERSAIKRDPENETAWQALGWAYGSIGQWKDARWAEEKAIGIRPVDASARMILGLALAHEGFLQEALIMEKKAQKLSPHDEGIKRSLTFIKQALNPPIVHKKRGNGFNPLLTPTPGNAESSATPGASQQLPPSPIKAPSVLH